MNIADDDQNPRPGKKLAKSLDAIAALRIAMEQRLADAKKNAPVTVSLSPLPKSETLPPVTTEAPEPPPESTPEPSKPEAPKPDVPPVAKPASPQGATPKAAKESKSDFKTYDPV